jgi:glycosyltransferase involved in cell wall biosynthesis
VFWQQDVISVAVDAEARRRFPVAGAAIGALTSRLERNLLAASDHIVVISEDFLPILQRWHLDGEAVSVIENWAPLEELGAAPITGARWAEAHDLVGRTVLMYTGTLGLKHNPGLLLDLARSIGDRDDVRVVVISEGLGADWLRAETEGDPAPALVLLPYQPYDVLPEVMASADVLVAILEPDAGVFSVPSKVLSYHCAGRPILAAIPAVNLAARIIERTGSGVVVEPSDGQGFVARAWELIEQPATRRKMGMRARCYAEETFDIAAIGTRFEDLLAGPDVDGDDSRRASINQHTVRRT